MTIVLAVLNALVALPKIAGYVEDLVAGIVAWYVQRQNTQTLSAIADAAALSSRAQTREDLNAASLAWQKALSRPRVG